MGLGLFKRKPKRVGVFTQVVYIIAWVKWVAEMAHWIADSLSNLPPIPIRPDKIITADEGQKTNNTNPD